MRKIYIMGALAVVFASCKPSVNITVPPKPGNADFTNYLAIGDNYTAGYADNSLTVTGQLIYHAQAINTNVIDLAIVSRAYIEV